MQGAGSAQMLGKNPFKYVDPFVAPRGVALPACCFGDCQPLNAEGMELKKTGS